MADIAVTANNVKADEGYQSTDGIAGEEILQGETCYLKASDSKYYKGDANNGTEPATITGIALNRAANGQPIRVFTGGTIDIGGTVVVGESYYQSRNAGKICPFADLLTGDYISFIGIGKTTAKIDTSIKSTGAQKA